MGGETDLQKMLAGMRPILNTGSYVFVSVPSIEQIPLEQVIASVKEKEGITLVMEKSIADQKGLLYDFVAAWITLEIHSALVAVGLTAAFSKALGESDISCNVIAGYFHDHIFVAEKDAEQALEVLKSLAKSHA